MARALGNAPIWSRIGSAYSRPTLVHSLSQDTTVPPVPIEDGVSVLKVLRIRTKEQSNQVKETDKERPGQKKGSSTRHRHEGDACLPR
jgi:hypothetical protein